MNTWTCACTPHSGDLMVHPNGSHMEPQPPHPPSSSFSNPSPRPSPSLLPTISSMIVTYDLSPGFGYPNGQNRWIDCTPVLMVRICELLIKGLGWSCEPLSPYAVRAHPDLQIPLVSSPAGPHSEVGMEGSSAPHAGDQDCIRTCLPCALHTGDKDCKHTCAHICPRYVL